MSGYQGNHCESGELEVTLVTSVNLRGVVHTGRKNGFSHIANVEQMHGKCYVCACLLRFAEKQRSHLPQFFTHGNARKCHICFKFAVVSKSTDNMVFFATFGGVVNMMLKLKFCNYFS